MLNDGGKIYRESFWMGLAPDPLMTVSQWADQYRVLSTKVASEPGKWRTSRTPYLKEIMDALSPSSPIEEVIFMKGAQIGGTECGNNWIGFIMDAAAAPMLAVSPTVDLAKRNSKQRIDSLIEESERLRGKVSEARSRDSGNTMLTKEFPGGILVMTGANSAVGLRSLPARYIFLDEVDAYPGDVDGEGDPVLLAKARTRTFARRKIYLCSTPTIQNRSRIEKEFNESDQRYYFLPCPHCGHMQRLVWSQLRWPENEPRKAAYYCEKCQAEIPEYHKTEMLSKGVWTPINPNPRSPRIAGFHISALYSPVGWFSWGECAELWIESKKDQPKLRGFINTILGETWKQPGDAPEPKRLYDLRESYPVGRIPMGGLLLTAGADVQKDRIEVEIVAWGVGKESWSIDYRVFHGDTSTPESEAFAELDRLLNEQFQHDSGVTIPIRMLAIDSGYNTQTVYNWCRKYPINRVIAIKGSESLPMVLGQPNAVDLTVRGQRIRRGFKVWSVGVNILKSELYGWLRLEKPIDGEAYPPGYCHFPEYALSYFEQLTAEQLVVRTIRGFSKYIWEKVRERNEALDCRAYARAAAAACGMDRFKISNWTSLADLVGTSVEARTAKTEQSNEKGSSVPVAHEAKAAAPLQRRKSRYL